MPSGPRPSSLPPGLAPLFLSREQAAEFVGVSARVFDAEVAAGLWPKAVRRGAKEGALTWYRPALEAMAATRHGLVAAGPGPAQPGVEDAKAAAEAAAIQGVRDAQARKQRHQHRPAKAR